MSETRARLGMALRPRRARRNRRRRSSSCRPSSTRGPPRRTARRRWRATDSAPPSIGWDGATARSPPTRPPSRRRPRTTRTTCARRRATAIAPPTRPEDRGGLPAVARGLPAAAAEGPGAGRGEPGAIGGAQSGRPAHDVPAGAAAGSRAARPADALAEFERVVALRPMPPRVRRSPRRAIEAGRLLEAAGSRARAIEQYTRASRVRGADGATRQAATQALERLRVPQSSR